MKLLLDMDGVIVDWYGAFHKLHGKNPYDDPKNHGIYWVPGWEEVKLDLGFWTNLPWTNDGLEILNLVETLFGKENICLVTNPSNCIMAASGKMLWIKRELPDYFKAQRYQIGGARHFGKDILLDDCEENVKLFGPQAVLVPRLWNSLHQRDTISHLKEELYRLIEIEEDRDTLGA